MKGIDMDGVGEGLMSDEELAGLLQNAIETSGSKGLHEDDMQVLVEWATGVRMEALMLELAISGEVRIGVEDGEPVFIHPDQVRTGE